MESLPVLTGDRYEISAGYPGDRETVGKNLVWGTKGDYVCTIYWGEIETADWSRIAREGVDQFVERMLVVDFKDGEDALVFICNNDPDLVNHTEKIAEEQERLAKWIEAYGNQLPLWDEGLPW